MPLYSPAHHSKCSGTIFNTAKRDWTRHFLIYSVWKNYVLKNKTGLARLQPRQSSCSSSGVVSATKAVRWHHMTRTEISEIKNLSVQMPLHCEAALELKSHLRWMRLKLLEYSNMQTQWQPLCDFSLIHFEMFWHITISFQISFKVLCQWMVEKFNSQGSCRHTVAACKKVKLAKQTMSKCPHADTSSACFSSLRGDIAAFARVVW